MSKFIFHTPLLSYRFIVSFWKDGEKLPFSDDITTGVVSVSSFSQVCSLASASNEEYVDIKIQDDVLNRSQRGIQSLKNVQDFSIKIDYKDCNESSIRTAFFNKCNVISLAHSQLDYTSPSKETMLSINFPEIISNKINVLRTNSPELDAIYTLLSSSQIELQGKKDVNAVVSTTMSIGYDSNVEWLFNS